MSDGVVPQKPDQCIPASVLTGSEVKVPAPNAMSISKTEASKFKELNCRIRLSAVSSGLELGWWRHYITLGAELAPFRLAG